MRKSKKRKRLIVVHSIKGGCGKTTISLALSQYFGKTNPKKVCYIDTDITGIGTISLAGKEAIKPRRTTTDFVLLNPFDDREFFKTDFEDTHVRYFSDFCHPHDNSFDRHFKAIFSTTDNDVMERAIQATSDMFFAEDVESKIRVLLAKLFIDDIDTIVLDTSPGIQGLTRIILKISKEICQEGKLRLAEDTAIDVIHICLCSNNFVHLIGLWEYLCSEKEFFFGDRTQTGKFLVVLNQVPLGVQFKSVPDSSIYYEKYVLDEIKANDYRVRKFAESLVGKVEEYGLSILHQAFLEYYSIKEKNFLPTFFENYDTNASKIFNIDSISDYVVVVPEQPDIRRMASDFGWEKGFDIKEFFKILKKECDSGHLQMLGKRVQEIVDSKNSKVLEER